MALPAHILDRLPQELRKNGLLRSAESLSLPLSGKPGWTRSESRLREAVPASRGAVSAPWGAEAVPAPWSAEEELRELLGCRGGVVELAVPGASLGTSLGLFACREAQRSAKGSERVMCAFIDSSRSLYAPGALRAGVSLEQLVVVRPDEEALARVALRLVESQLFSVVVIDLVGTQERPLDIALGGWVRLVRRMNLALEGSRQSVVLLTEQSSRRALPLPVAQRIELSRRGPRELSYSIVRDRRGGPKVELSLSWPLPGIRSGKKNSSSEGTERHHGVAS